jgi:hypothetical protein
MADIETSLKSLTLQNTAVATAVGQRYYLDRIPDSTPSAPISYPLIKAQTISDTGYRTQSGTFGGTALIQLDVWDDDKPTCNQTAETLRAWLDNYKGGMGDLDVTIQIRNMPSSPDSDTKLFRRILEAQILCLKRNV